MISKTIEEENKRLEHDNLNLYVSNKNLSFVIEGQEKLINELTKYKNWYYNHRSEADKGC